MAGKPRTRGPGLSAACGQRVVPGMQGGSVKGAVANDPTFGARTQSVVLLLTGVVVVVIEAWARRAAALLLAADA